MSEVLEELIDRLAYIHVQPKRFLLLGNFPAEAVKRIWTLYPKAESVLVNHIEPKPIWKFLRRSQTQVFTLPLPWPAFHFDVILSSNFCESFETLFPLLQEFARILSPQGMLMFTTERMTQDMHDLGDDLLKLGFENPVMDTEWFQDKKQEVIFGHAWGVKVPRGITQADGSVKVPLHHLSKTRK